MTDTDVTDRLYAAFTDPHASRGPQLLADAHAEIVRLRAAVDTEGREYRARHAALDDLAEHRRQVYARDLDRALAAAGTRWALANGHIRFDLKATRRRLEHHTNYAAMVDGLADQIRHRLALKDDPRRLVEAVANTLDNARSHRHRAAAADRKNPGRIPA